MEYFCTKAWKCYPQKQQHSSRIGSGRPLRRQLFRKRKKCFRFSASGCFRVVVVVDYARFDVGLRCLVLYYCFTFMLPPTFCTISRWVKVKLPSSIWIALKDKNILMLHENLSMLHACWGPTNSALLSVRNVFCKLSWWAAFFVVLCNFCHEARRENFSFLFCFHFRSENFFLLMEHFSQHF